MEIKTVLLIKSNKLQVNLVSQTRQIRGGICTKSAARILSNLRRLFANLVCWKAYILCQTSTCYLMSNIHLLFDVKHPPTI